MNGKRALSGLRATEYVLALGGISLLAWCGFVLLGAGDFQRRENRDLDRLIGESAALASVNPANPVTPPPPARKPPGLQRTPPGLIGRVEIPRLGLAVIVMEGSDEAVLRRAAGHVPGTALPGENGNIAITGHRDTFFRPLREIRRNDLIRLTTPAGGYSYRVVSISVVSPDFNGVLEGDGNETLTLITCFPFSFVGPAPRRFVVRAERAPL